MSAGDLDPKKQFRASTPEQFKAFSEMIGHPAMKLGMNMALIGITQSGITTEELNGAKKYMHYLNTLAETNTLRRLPAKTLSNG